MKSHKVPTTVLSKISQKTEPSVTSIIAKQRFGMMVCVPSFDHDNHDAYAIRRLAVDNHIPLFTNPESGRLLMRCLADKKLADPDPKAWQDYLKTNGYPT